MTNPALKALLGKWREEAMAEISPEKIDSDDKLFTFYVGNATGLRRAADELEAALTAAPATKRVILKHPDHEYGVAVDLPVESGGE